MLVVETIGPRQRVIAASRTARSHGVRRGMALADARMRLPEAALHERSRAAETAAMTRLAGWAWRYSSQIHWAIQDHDIECARLIIEIGASLRLFGGRRPLLAAIRDDLRWMRYACRAGLGDTPQAALAFSRVRHGSPDAAALATLPVACLDLDTATHDTLAASGFRQAGELLALPPSTLVRRFGKTPLLYLEQLRGRRPHGLPLYELPQRYRTHHELIGAVESTAGLIFTLRRIFAELSIFLRGTDRALQTLRLSLVHERRPTTRVTLRLSASSHDAGHLERVACERLKRVTLAAPVIEIGLVSDRLRPAEHRQNAFWHQSEPRADETWPGVLDRLRARLGPQAVRWLDTPADHRPEQASIERDSEPSRAALDDDGDALPRPLWLLDPPERLGAEALDAMHWISGPERIESGWWDTGQRRDYYRAFDPRGRLLWVFRDLNASDPVAGYFLHGLFG